MANKIQAHLRLTHRYVDEYGHLDQWDTLHTMEFKMLGGRDVRVGNGYDDLGSKRHRVIGSKKLDQNKQAQALRDTLSYHGCSHSYDCCGCSSRSARVTKVKPGIFSVLLSISRNY